MIGYTHDKDITFNDISVYVNGSLSSPTENPELFGCLIGFNGASGYIMHIYVFAELTVQGKATSLAGLLAANALDDDKETIEIEFCVVNVDFKGVISNNANIGGMFGDAKGNVKVTDCQSHGKFDFEITDLEDGYVGFAGVLGKTTRNAHMFKVYSTIEMNIFSYTKEQEG